MPGNVPNTSRNSFDFSKRYGPVIFQQGVPVMDSDVNELMDNLWIRGTHVVNHATVGDCRLEHTQLGGTKNSNTGMQIIQHATVTVNDFTITDGWAMVGGVLVPSTAASPPASFDYEDQIIFTGTVDSVGSGNLTDTEKNWSADHALTNCRVKMLDGPEVGSIFTVTGLISATTVSLSGGTGGIVSGNTYEVYPPALTTPSGTDRDDLVYLMVFFDDTATEEDSAITHPGTGVESVHKSRIVPVVRVLEGSTTMPSSTEANLISYGIRYLKLGILERLNGNSNVLTAMITNEDNIRGPLTHLAAGDVAFDDTVTTGLGFSASTYVQDALDTILGELNASTGAALLGGAAITDSPDSVGAGTIQAMLTAILGHVNDRIETIHPETAPTTPQLVWRSHGITSDANVTGDTVSIYIKDNDFVICRGMYIGTTTATRALVSPENEMQALIIGQNQIGLFTYYSTSPTTWNWTVRDNWYRHIDLGGSGTPTQIKNSGSMYVPNPGYFDFNHEAGAWPYWCFRGGSPYLTTNWGLAKRLTEAYLLSNCVIDNGSTSTVTPVDTGEPSASLRVGSDYGHFRFSGTTENKASYSSGWTLYNPWSATMDLMVQANDKGASDDYVYNCFNSTGNVYEEIVVDLSFDARLYTGGGDTLSFSTAAGYNFRNRFSSAPSTIDITGLTTSNSTPYVYAANNWGFRMESGAISAAAVFSMDCYGNVECYT